MSTITTTPTASATAASQLEMKGVTRAVALRVMVAPAVPVSSWLKKPPRCVLEPPNRKSISPSRSTIPTATAPTAAHRRHPRRTPASPAPSATRAGTRVRAPPMSAPISGAASRISAITPGNATSATAAACLLSRDPCCAATNGPAQAAIVTRREAAASAKAVLDMP